MGGGDPGRGSGTTGGVSAPRIHGTVFPGSTVRWGSHPYERRREVIEGVIRGVMRGKGGIISSDGQTRHNSGVMDFVAV